MELGLLVLLVLTTANDVTPILQYFPTGTIPFLSHYITQINRQENNSSHAFGV